MRKRKEDTQIEIVSMQNLPLSILDELYKNMSIKKYCLERALEIVKLSEDSRLSNVLDIALIIERHLKEPLL